ncbi:hypothetical protein L484_022100 [Morus notabilis]|uniref:Uncharacterized protein n=1 Tax=Morus notabilis TaxID=981085 RepID=W9QDQ9_9ROSA|nr:hypothetical protein L484_022100 [Morus notabilis]
MPKNITKRRNLRNIKSTTVCPLTTENLKGLHRHRPNIAAATITGPPPQALIVAGPPPSWHPLRASHCPSPHHRKRHLSRPLIVLVQPSRRKAMHKQRSLFSTPWEALALLCNAV